MGKKFDPSPETLHGHELAEAILHEHPEFADVHILEVDETVPPRPEEDIADGK
ncbi:hypothetical protein IEU95_07565 [Hoyosella rhizosphaerae]|uniref:Uncharacterized protein n=1 Tax=Hoyosella rhizosphaerae TaxID=1755582 RepID=A0A916X9G8_9ACTN|nr:hypothetical protein [Hoyosella rhizosphaerae]MBN4926682.1 hypothetical protein [Hoyosella rhizosphaerae]GGC57266.1 hypothetical protein GCM10011410_07250 [Hoyosella rhizosphaerae]